MSRKKSREYAFRYVFENFFHDSDEYFDVMNEDIVLEDTDKEFANSLIGGINEHYQEINDIISSNVVGYDIDRIYKVDLAILVLAVYEIKFADGADKIVVINEAVELAKKYSTDKSYSFINGVLAKVVA
ncbi:MAG: transcription antitermination factor NusB [Clostridiales bacterium]|nr:transcription antitermination factor NusB [Clostridiales bacterium]